VTISQADGRRALSGERLLLYTVGGEPYASLLDDLREVIDIPWPHAGGPPVIHGHAVAVRPLDRLLVGRRAGGMAADMASLLVVETPAGWVGLLAERVQGMHRGGDILPVPDEITTLPAGSIMGAMILGKQGEVEADGAPATERIILVLDVQKLAAAALEEEAA